MGYDEFIARCRERFAFLEEHGLEPRPASVSEPQECAVPWAGPAGSVTAYSEYHGRPSVYVRPAGFDRGLGLGRAREVLDPDRQAPDGDDPAAWVDFWSALLADHLEPILLAPGPLLAELREARAQREEQWCGAFFASARPAFAFLVDEHGFQEPLPATDPAQCSLNYRSPSGWVLVHRHQGEPPAVWIDPGEGGHFALRDALVARGLADDLPPGLERLGVLGAALRAHPDLLQPDPALREAIAKQRRQRHR